MRTAAAILICSHLLRSYSSDSTADRIARKIDQFEIELDRSLQFATSQNQSIDILQSQNFWLGLILKLSLLLDAVLVSALVWLWLQHPGAPRSAVHALLDKASDDEIAQQDSDRVSLEEPILPAKVAGIKTPSSLRKSKN